MTLLSKPSLHQQITYRPPSDFQVTQLEIEAINRLEFQQAEMDTINLRFELEVARIRDLTKTGCFWSMMQACDIYDELKHYLQGLNTPQSQRLFEDLWPHELGFPDWFWQELMYRQTWGNQWTEDEDFFFFKEEDDSEINGEELDFLYQVER